MRGSEDDRPGVKAVILDYTGVITVPLAFLPTGGGVATPLPGPADAPGPFDPQVMRALLSSELRNDDPQGMWNRLERGEVALAEVADWAEQHLTGARSFMLDVVGSLMTRLAVRHDVVAAVGRWKAAGLKTAVLTNNVDEWRPLWHAKLRDAGAFDLFDVIVDSSQVGMRKPEPRIYLHTAAQLGVEPGQCAFIDDFEHNVAGAARVGMRAILATPDDLHLDEIESLLAR